MIIHDSLLTLSSDNVVLTEFVTPAVDPSRIYNIMDNSIDDRIELIQEEITQTKFEHY